MPFAASTSRALANQAEKAQACLPKKSGRLFLQSPVFPQKGLF